MVSSAACWYFEEECGPDSRETIFIFSSELSSTFRGRISPNSPFGLSFFALSTAYSMYHSSCSVNLSDLCLREAISEDSGCG